MFKQRVLHWRTRRSASFGKAVRIIIEQEPGAADRTVTDRYKRHVLRGYNVRGERATGAKDVRASVAAAAAENGLIKSCAAATQTNSSTN